MKKVSVIALALGLASAANGATLSMFFPGGQDEWTTYPSDTIEVEVYLDLCPGDNVSTVWFEFEAAEALSLTSTAAAQPGWGASGVMGDLGYALAQVAYGDQSGGAGTLFGPATGVLVGTFTLHVGLPYAGFEYELMFTSVPDGTHATIWNAAAGALTWHPSYAAMTYSGYWTYGKGASDVPAAKTTPGLTKDPLIVIIPEPISLSLLALGGLLTARRRR